MCKRDDLCLRGLRLWTRGEGVTCRPLGSHRAGVALGELLQQGGRHVVSSHHSDGLGLRLAVPGTCRVLLLRGRPNLAAGRGEECEGGRQLRLDVLNEAGPHRKWDVRSCV